MQVKLFPNSTVQLPFNIMGFVSHDIMVEIIKGG